MTDLDATPDTRASRKAAKKNPTPRFAPADASVGEVLPWEVRGNVLRDKPRRAERGYYFPSLVGAPSTTRQGAVLNTALIGDSTGTEGIPSGRDRLSHRAAAHDPFTAYNQTPRLITSPNCIVLGGVGAAKSSFVKTVFVARPAILKNRRAVIFDKKSRGNEGEYAELVREFGSEPIRFASDGSGTRFNILDPRVTRGGGARGTARLVQTLIRLADGNRPLTAADEEAVRAALRLTRAHYGDEARDPVFTDVLRFLPHVTEDDTYKRYPSVSRDSLALAGARVQWVLNGLMEDYGALLDGDTTANVDLTGKITSFDLSQLPEEGPAVPVVMAIGNMWLLGRVKEERGFQTNVIYEEGWHMIGGPAAELLKPTQKLSRSLGISNVFVMHKGTDIPEDSPGYAMVQEAQSVYIYRQDRPADAEWCQRAFDLHEDTAALLPQLGPGEHVMKIGARSEVHVQHIRSAWEAKLTDTDEAMATAED